MPTSRQERCADGFCCRTAYFSAFKIEFLLLSAQMQNPPNIQPKTNNLAMQQGPSWNSLAFRCHPPGDQEFLTAEWSYCEPRPTSADFGIPITLWKPSEPQLLQQKFDPTGLLLFSPPCRLCPGNSPPRYPVTEEGGTEDFRFQSERFKKENSSPGPELGNQGPKIPRLVQIKRTYKPRSLFP